MNASGTWLVADECPSTWSNGKDHSGRRSTGIAVALIVHGLAAWLVLSGVGKTIVQGVVRTTTVIVLPPPPEPEPPAVRPTDPVNQRSVTHQQPVVPVVVPVPEDTASTSADAPILASQQGTASDTLPVTGTTPQSIPGPRGFGSITNRADCSAAFSQSFPREARRNAQQGAVTLQVRVSASGAVEAAEVISANPRRVFDRAALGVILSGACRFESDAAGYLAVLEINYKLSGESPD